jgi:hypothetical protein
MAKRAARTDRAKAEEAGSAPAEPGKARSAPAKAKSKAKAAGPTLAERCPALAATESGPGGTPPSAASLWREARNAAARARLEKSLPAVFPAPVLRHALAHGQHCPDIGRGRAVALLGGAAIPDAGAFGVFFQAQATLIKCSKPVLGLGKAS